jgi:hypothetical protein
MHHPAFEPIVDHAWVEASVDRFDPQTTKPTVTVGFLLVYSIQSQPHPTVHSAALRPEVKQKSEVTLLAPFVGAKHEPLGAKLSQLSGLWVSFISRERR